MRAHFGDKRNQKDLTAGPNFRPKQTRFSFTPQTAIVVVVLGCFCLLEVEWQHLIRRPWVSVELNSAKNTVNIITIYSKEIHLLLRPRSRNLLLLCCYYNERRVCNLSCPLEYEACV